MIIIRMLSFAELAQLLNNIVPFICQENQFAAHFLNEVTFNTAIDVPTVYPFYINFVFHMMSSIARINRL